MRVQGEGNPNAELFLIGEGPGADEDREGRPFVGKAGRELDRYLNGYVLPTRDELWITNLVRERCVTASGQNREPTAEEIARDKPDLDLELEMVKPLIIATLGRSATRAFMGDVDMEMVHGLSHWTGEYTVFPCYHPAAALHSPELQALVAFDFIRLGKLLRNELMPQTVDEHPGLYGEDEEPRLKPGRIIAIDTEGSVEKPWCLSFSQEDGEGWVVRTPEGWKRFADQIRHHTGTIYLHNALHDLAVLRTMGITLPEESTTDTMILAYLLGTEPQGLKPLAYRHAGMTQASYEEITREAQTDVETRWLLDSPLPEKVKARGIKSKVGLKQWWAAQKPETQALVTAPFPEATLDDVERLAPGRAIRYAARDADCTLRIAPVLEGEIALMELDEIEQVDNAIVPMIDRMQSVGLLADLNHFEGLSVLLDCQMMTLRSQLVALAEREDFNPGSGDQVAWLLFDKLRLPKGKRTKSGDRYSTADAHLEAIREYHPAVALVLDFREAQKLKGTYVDPMPGFIHTDGRLHPRFRITRVASGRLAASEPNVLAFPKHSELGKLVRMGFRAADGHLLGEWDLDQIEMRVMAHDSGDETMIAEFLSGVDKHTSTAARIFGIKPELIKGEQRFAAKAVNFGILMGMTKVGLTAQFHKNGQRQWTEDDCQRLLDEYFRIYPGVARYVSNKHAEARRYGYVRDMWGRVRYLAGVHSPDSKIREEALRQAQATPIQSGAQGIIKRIMRALWPQIVQLRRSSWVEPLLQIHDALIFEFDESVRTVLDETVMQAMRGTVTLRVPVTAKAAVAARWGEL